MMNFFPRTSGAGLWLAGCHQLSERRKSRVFSAGRTMPLSCFTVAWFTVACFAPDRQDKDVPSRSIDTSGISRYFAVHFVHEDRLNLLCLIVFNSL